MRDGKVFTNDSQESKPISKWPGVPKAWASEGAFIEAVRQEVLLTEQMDSSTFYVNDVEVLTKYDSRYILRRTNQIFSSDIPSKKSDIDGLVAELKATGIYVDVQTELTPSRNKYSRKLLINAKNVEHIQEITISEVVLSGLPEVDNAEFQSALARRDITNNSYLSKHSFSELEGKISEALIEVYPNTAAEKEEMGTAWVTIRPDGEKRVKLIVSPEDLGSNVR